jgi:hypothetical protein
MPVNTEHKDFTKMSPRWSRCCDAYDGQDAVHKNGPNYLPRLKDQQEPDYQAYLLRTPFYNATYRTITGLVGMLFRQPPKMEVPETLKPMLDDVTMSGDPFHLFVQDIATDALKLGRIGVLVDYPMVNGPQTLADAAKLNLRPTMQIYEAQSIINWKTSNIDNKTVLSLVVLKEEEKIFEDEFKYRTDPRWRVLDLVNGMYRMRMFERKQDKDVVISEIYPKMNGAPLNYIPFIFIGTDDVTPEIDEPPLIDLVNMNMSHFRTTADLEHGAHFTGLPTPVITGYSPDTPGEKLYIGSASAWIFPRPETKVSYLEFSGSGLDSLEKMLAQKEQQMAVLGARMLEPQRRGVEAPETAAIHRKGEESMLASVAQAISLGVLQALKWFADWAKVDSSSIKYELNRDFYPAPMNPQMLSALVASWQSGAISDQTLFQNLQQAEIIDKDTTLEDEQARIADQQQRFAAAAAAFPMAGGGSSA